MLRLKAIFESKERALFFRSKLDILTTELPFSLHKLVIDSEVIPIPDSSSFHFVLLFMRDYNHNDEDDSPEQTFTHSVTSTVPHNDDLVMFQALQTSDSFVFNCAEKAHIVDKAICVQQFPSLKDCSDNFLALSAELHNQFDGRSVSPSGVPLFVVIPEEIGSTTISSSLSSKIYTTVKVCIYFYTDEAGAAIVSRFKHFENGPNHSVLLYLAAAHPQLFVQCLNWKGVFSFSAFEFPANHRVLLSAQRTLETWRQESPSFLPELVIPYDESVLCASIPPPPVTLQPSSSREAYSLRNPKKWSQSPDT